MKIWNRPLKSSSHFVKSWRSKIDLHIRKYVKCFKIWSYKKVLATTNFLLNQRKWELQLTIFSDQIYIETNIIGIYYLKTHLNKLEKIGPHICQVTNSCKKIWYVNFSSSCYFHLVNTSCMQIMVAEFYFSLACIQYTSIHLKSFKISFAKSIGYMWESKASLLVHTHCAQCCVTFLNYLAK